MRRPERGGDPAADRRRAEQLVSVSRETWQRLEALVELVTRWTAVTNLVSPDTLPHIWTRHVADSLQLLQDAPPDARIWVDLGSGGGFPALPVACVLAEWPGAQVHMVESVQRKAAFLREAVRKLALPATVHCVRIEDLDVARLGQVDVVSARALAPLPRLLDLAWPLLKTGAIGLFPKGQDVAQELTEAAQSWRFEVARRSSLTDSRGTILRIASVAPADRPRHHTGPAAP